MLKELLAQNLKTIQDKIYDFNMETRVISEWSEENIYLTSESKFSGLLSFKRSPYTIELLNNMMPNSGIEVTAVMKCSQSGFTQCLAIPCLVYHAAESPTNQMFITSSETLIRNTIRGRFDTVMEGKTLKGIIKSTSTKKANQRTGDTDFKKEYTGGSLINITYKPTNLRFHSVEVGVCDEYDDAPKIDKKEGSIFDLIMARTKSYADTRRLAFISSPTIKGQSNIEGVYDLGDKRKWNWECPHCKTYIPILWRVDREDGTFGGIKWDYDENDELDKKSVHYECQNCCGRIEYNMKYSLNLTGKWIPTAIPKEAKYRSYSFNALCNPPGFESWAELVGYWLLACPKGQPVNIEKLKVFTNVQLGELWEDRGTTPRMTALMDNIRRYEIGKIPDETCETDGNGRIALITLTCDLGGVMDILNKIEDVRLDWSIVAHTTNGQTYDIDHGSIGTFKRSKQTSQKEREKDYDRVRWTFKEGVQNSVWPIFKDQITRSLEGESGIYYDIDVTIVDTGHFTKLSYNFIQGFSGTKRKVFGIKGKSDESFRKNDRDMPLIKHSTANKGLLYILDVDKLKDNLASNMALTEGTDGTQPNGFMNFPQPSGGKYNKKNYFDHYESEHRVPEIKSGVEVGFIWKKKSENNHFWDCAVYTLAAREIFIADLKLEDPANRELTWDRYCYLINM
jgi:phage terminase large subunit GpA-like protein